MHVNHSFVINASNVLPDTGLSFALRGKKSAKCAP
jgi:hypothetical protein